MKVCLPGWLDTSTNCTRGLYLIDDKLPDETCMNDDLARFPSVNEWVKRRAVEMEKQRKPDQCLRSLRTP